YELQVLAMQRALPDAMVFGLSLAERMVVTFLLTLFMAMLAGLYPAFYLTSFRPIEALKGKLTRGLGAARLRNGLVVLQFSISMAMIICTLVVLRQWQYSRQADVGFNRDQVLLIEDTDNLGDDLYAYMDAIRSQSGVISASGTTSIPGTYAWGDFWTLPGSDKTTTLSTIQTDPDFDITLGLELKEGRYLSDEFPSDSAAIVLNEAAVAEFGLEAPVLGKQVVYSSPFPGQPSHYTVVGVMKDFHMADFNQSIGSLGMLIQNGRNMPMNTNFITIRYQADQTAEVIAAAQSIWEGLQVETTFSYGFLDETFGQLFEAEETLTQVFAIFSGLTIFIACLGLFGLAAFTAERRTKEVGVRKVLGATEGQLLGMLNRHFTRLVLISFLIGAPVAAYLMNLWLSDFVYKIDLSPWIFLVGGLAGLLIAWMTVSFQSWRVARLNPVQSLRDE
ncbi:MAG: FtsX-like permease family protein, partial [Bacteroidota bacterium]